MREQIKNWIARTFYPIFLKRFKQINSEVFISDLELVHNKNIKAYREELKRRMAQEIVEILIEDRLVRFDREKCISGGERIRAVVNIFK